MVSGHAIVCPHFDNVLHKMQLLLPTDYFILRMELRWSAGDLLYMWYTGKTPS